MFRSFVNKFFSILFVMLLLPATAQAKESVPWLVYLYLTGSDLESGDGEPDSGGSATSDFQEIIEGSVGKNVRFLILTGGSEEWQNEIVSSKHLEVYEVFNGDVNRLQRWDNASMGDPKTLEKFISYGENNYAPQHRMMIFWDHGAGPTGGVAYDENFDDDFLSLSEIDHAFGRVFGKNYKPFEIIGFDACLMASLSSGYFMTKWAHAMIASEETEPATGWDYTPWMKALEKKPNMSIKELGKLIVDTYLESCDREGVTLSMVSLDEAANMVLAYNELGMKLLKSFSSNTKILTELDRASKKSQTYGSVDRKNRRFSDVIDLKLYTNALSHLAPNEVKKVNDALGRYVIYNGVGKYIKGNGVSVNYPVGKLVEKYNAAYQYALPTPFGILYGFQTRALDEKRLRSFAATVDKVNDYMEWVRGFSKFPGYLDNYGKPTSTQPSGDSEPGSFQSHHLIASNIGDGGLIAMAQANQTNANEQQSDIKKLEDLKITVAKNGDSFVVVPENLIDTISSVEMEFSLVFLPGKDFEKGLIVDLGTDALWTADWDKGKFTDTVKGEWPALDGHELPIRITGNSDDYITYDCDVKVNGIPHNMSIVYNNETGKYSITGIQRINSNGVPDRTGRALKNGDEITTVFYAETLLDDDEKAPLDLETFKYKSDMTIEDVELGESKLVYYFVFKDSYGNEASSEMVVAEINDEGNMEVQTFSDFLDEYKDSLSGSDEDEDEDDEESDDEVSA